MNLAEMLARLVAIAAGQLGPTPPVDQTHGPPFTEYEAEDAQTTGTIIGPDRRAGTLASEASGRRGVLLDHDGQTVVFTLIEPANALTIRYALPDSASGKGLSSSLKLRVGDRDSMPVPITSKFSWFYGKYPFTNRPGDGRAHHFWDEVRVLLPEVFPAGTTITIEHSTWGAAWAAIDLLDAEKAPPSLPPPDAAIAATAFGADPSGRRNSRHAFDAAMRAARQSGRPLFIPAGSYRVDGHLVVDKVAISGAGPWRTTIFGRALGFYARKGGSTGVSLSNFAVESNVDERRDRAPLAAIGGTFSRSSFANLFLHHAKVGVWLDGPATQLSIRGLRITDQTADGINLHKGISDAVVEENFIRNVGDDGIALWSDGIADARINVSHNRIVAPLLANGIALYGGRDIAVHGNVIADTVTEGGGIHLGTRFRAAPFAGTIELSDNVLKRTGSLDPNWRFGIGALWFYALERPIEGATIVVRNTVAIDSSCEAMQFLGPHSTSSITIDGFKSLASGGVLAALQTRGSVTVANATSSGRASGDVVDVPPGFRLIDGGGNHGWTAAPRMEASQPTCDRQTVGDRRP